MAAASSSGSDREKVQRIYERFNEMFRAEQSKSKALLNQRDYLVELLGLQEEQWTTRLGYLQSRLDQKKIEEAKWKNYYATKNNILINVKDDQISLHRNNAELTEKDLENYHKCIVSLNSENSDLNKKLEASQTLNSKTLSTSSQNDPKIELQKQKQAYKTLKTDYETLKKEKNHKIAGLITEKDFSWHQYELTQKNFETLKNSRNLELEKANLANEKLKKLLEETEINKDGMIDRLNEEIRNLKRMNEEKDKIISRLKNETVSKTVQSRNNNKRKLEEQERSGMNLRSRNIKRKLDEQESSETSSEKSLKTDRKNGTKRKFESGKDGDVAIISRSRAKKNIDLCNSGMRACSSNSQRSTTKIYLSSIKIPKVNNNISHLQD